MAPDAGLRRCAVGDLPEPGRVAVRLWRTYHRMRYEDFAYQPRHIIELTLAGLSPSLCPSQSAPIGKGCVVHGRSHGLSGNTSRFRCGVVTLQVDEACREWMSRRDRFVVTAIALPLLLRYGRRPLGRPSPRASDE